ncbi:M14 family metallopeptidase [Glaciecola petra]|uniref:M14-type cytosolic carboxypeptidase n=1 Tax=Glaciecola petra TaxID=3075602 RepID=A0ABU2ZN39_9ALTE|nr:M14-type cytosolic carboxypeptidase [Aestuariibacter sp. P117]MDT0594042.1 M14-type cytosolic carboxypeptidase [Aestuariibacter sp. P117]
MIINSQFDSGNINVISAESPGDIKLFIKKDHQSDFYQWFHFKLHSEAFVAHSITIVDLAKSAYPEGWKGYHAVASYDRETWFRVDSVFDGDNLSIEFTPEQNSVYFAYFAPYSYERHLNFIAQAQQCFDCRHELLGLTLDGREINLLVIGSEDIELAAKNKIWITARQHPGETMAEWLVEGLVQRLLDEDDGLARKLLQHNVFYIVPNMNPDGSVRGHLRTNAAGINLNREWQNPSLNNSPEVLYVLNKMQETGVDMFFDIHGDEALPYNFVAGGEGNPNYSEQIKELEDLFKETLLTVTPEFQDVFGYDKDKPGEANLTVASNAVGFRYECLAYTLEMPFKDNANLPDASYGWSVPRCKQLGEDLLIAINAVSDKLKTK